VPPMSEPIALIDMDGTLCDFSGAMRRDLEAIRSPDEPPLPSDIYNDDALDRAWLKARRRMIKCQPDWWLNLQPLPLGMNILKLLMHCGFEVHILTKGPRVPNDAWAQKVGWIRNYLPPEVQITITQDKSLVYGKILVDDWPLYIERWLQWRPRGLVLMPDQPWNQDFNPPNVCRITDRDMPGGIDGVPVCTSWLLTLIEEIKDRKSGEDWKR
jgi:5'-nucleotidase